MPDSLTNPQVACLPHEAAFPALLATQCQALGLPAPVVWDATCLPQSLRTLLDTPPAAAPPAAPVALPASVVVLHRVPLEQVQALRRTLRSAGTRPILAVSTPTNLAFPLATLLAHLTQDRAREDAARQARPG